VPSPVIDSRIAQQKPDDDSKKPLNRRRGWPGVLAGLLVGVLGLAATRLGWLWPNFDVLSNFTLHCIFWIVAFALATIVPRFKVLTAIVLMIAMVTIWGARSYVGNDHAVPATNSNTRVINIAHFNTKARNHNNDAIQEQLETFDADIVTILEARVDKLPMIENLRKRYPYIHGCIGIDKCEMAILSKFPFVATSKPAPAPAGALPYVWVKFGADLGSLTYIGIHSQRFPNMKKQWAHVEDLRHLIESQSGNIVLTGDFNTTPFSRTMSAIEQGTGLTRLTNLATWPSQMQLPQLAIDHILVSKGVSAASPEYAGLAAGSDHLPIHMRLAISLH
jgi:endonuclease/exonuclease/phosphatase (EEP) superfamily protein YafD